MKKISSINIEKVVRVFSENYVLVPLEVFGNDSYKTLISTMMSSRTKDEVTLKVSNKLFKIAPDIESLSKLSVKEIEELIYPVGFYKTKARHLKKISLQLMNTFNCSVPKTRGELTSLPGVGRKTANLVLNRSFGVDAIAVDTHVHKISNILGWVNSKNPEDTEKQLMKILPKKYWGQINRLFVSIGRQHNSQKKLIKFLENNSLL